MSKVVKNMIRSMIVCIICAFTCFGVLNFSTEQVKADNVLTLKKGSYAKWIDRINFGDKKSDALDFYEWLIENSDNDGEEDALIAPETAEEFDIRDANGNPTGKKQYVHTYKVYSETITTSSNNPYGVIQPIAQRKAS